MHYLHSKCGMHYLHSKFARSYKAEPGATSMVSPAEVPAFDRKHHDYALPDLGALFGTPFAQPAALFDQLTAPRMQQMLRVQRHAVQDHGDSFQETWQVLSEELFAVITVAQSCS